LHELVETRGGPQFDQLCEHVGEVSLLIDAVQFAGLCRMPNYAEWFYTPPVPSALLRTPFGILLA
jgi:hypothetical protein